MLRQNRVRAFVSLIATLIVAAATWAHVAPRVGLGPAVVTAVSAALLVGYVAWATRPSPREPPAGPPRS